MTDEPRRPPEHGTYGGFQSLHRNRGEESCDACREARNAYMRERRKSNPQILRVQKERERVRNRALSRLARIYPDAYRALLSEEYRREREKP
jgi:hypothetical protein